ncbi:hypothetical protein E2C01_045965 [Portunus trituberculatus]|uniref:Uncharacterized protein n=1 Tax=Portunus trituberculatus TaxID=210409 RepID=A0A5B7G3T2_PORTR|nr:hypothetical protein [Portunus trituberculatus]
MELFSKIEPGIPLASFSRHVQYYNTISNTPPPTLHQQHTTSNTPPATHHQQRTTTNTCIPANPIHVPGGTLYPIIDGGVKICQASLKVWVTYDILTNRTSDQNSRRSNVV